MKQGHIYKLNFPYEDGQGSKNRPVFIIVITVDNQKALGLKITRTPRHNRVPITKWKKAGLKAPSHIQFDYYETFDNVTLTSIGVLDANDFKAVARAFKQYHGV